MAALKEDLVDAVNDLKSKSKIWNLTPELQKRCDGIIKTMVLCQGDQDSPGQVYDLVRALFDVLREVMKLKGKQHRHQDDQIQEYRETQSLHERRLIKNIEIVIDVLRKASEKVGKTGEKEWKDVIEQQGYVLEEVLKQHNDLTKQQRVGTAQKKARAVDDFEVALQDFNFCLNKALDQVVSQD